MAEKTNVVYVAVITYSIPWTDGKRKLRHAVEAFPTKEGAVAFVDNAAGAWITDARKYRIGGVYTIARASE